MSNLPPAIGPGPQSQGNSPRISPEKGMGNSESDHETHNIKARLKRVLSRRFLKKSNDTSSDSSEADNELKTSKSGLLKRTLSRRFGAPRKQSPPTSPRDEKQKKPSFISNLFHRRSPQKRSDSSSEDSSLFKSWRAASLSNTSRSTSLPIINRCASPQPDIEPTFENRLGASFLRKKLESVSLESDIDSVEETIKGIIRQTSFNSLGSSVNHVWEIREAYYKAARDGGVDTANTETLAYWLSVFFNLSQYFAPTKKIIVSPRSAANLIIESKKEQNLKKSCSSSIFTKNSKKSSKTRNRSLSDGRDDNTPITLSMQKALPGKSLKEVVKEGETLYETYIRINKLPDTKQEKQKFREKFTIGSWINILFGVWDGSLGNYNFDSDILYFDNTRTCPAPEGIILWGDEMRLTFYSEFLNDDNFYEKRTEKEIALIKKKNKFCLNQLGPIDTFLSETKQGKELTEGSSPEWFSQKLLIDGFRARITRTDEWINNRTGRRTLDELVCAAFPYYGFFAVVYIIVNELQKCAADNDSDLPTKKLWKTGMLMVGRESNLMALLDRCFELGINPQEVYDECQSPYFSYEKTLLNFFKKLKDPKPTLNRDDLNTLKRYFYSICKIDYKDIPKKNINGWLISSLYKICEPLKISSFNPNAENAFSAEEMQPDLHSFTLKALFSEGYFISFEEDKVPTETESEGGESSTDKNSTSPILCNFFSVGSKGQVKVHQMPIFTVDRELRIRVSNEEHSMPFSKFNGWIDKMKKNIKTEISLDLENNINFADDYAPHYADQYWKQKFGDTDITCFDIDEWDIEDRDALLEFRKYEAFIIFNKGFYISIYSSEAEENVKEEKKVKKNEKCFDFIYRDEKGEHQTLNLDVRSNPGKLTFSYRDQSYAFTFEEFRGWIKDEILRSEFHCGKHKISVTYTDGKPSFTLQADDSTETYPLELNEDEATVRFGTEEKWMTIQQLRSAHSPL